MYRENGRKHFYQWELNQRLVVPEKCTSVQYSNGTLSEPLGCEIKEENGIRYADVPNILLQTAADLHAYAWDEDTTSVVAHSVFGVEAMPKPAQYAYTQTEVKRYDILLAELEAKGAYYTPSVDAEGNLEWQKSLEQMPDVLKANIRGPQGEKGEPGTALIDDAVVGDTAWSSRKILDQLGVVENASGETICLTDCLNMPTPIKGLKAWVMAKQEGEGTPSAENVRPIVPFDMSMVTIGIDSAEEMPNPTLYSSGTLPENTYGGYVDWLRGVFVQTHEYVVADGTKGKIYKNGNVNFYIAGILSKAQSQTSTGALQSTGMCDSIPYRKGTEGEEVYCSLANIWFNNFTGISTAEEVAAYLQENPVHIVYPLETPIEHPLADMPDTEVLLTEAPCYISSDGSNLEVMYVADTKAYIDKKFAELQDAMIALGSI